MNIIIGVYKDARAADNAILALHNNGFKEDRVGTLSNKAAVEAYLETDPEATEGGLLAGGLAGLLVGVTAITVPGVGPVFTAGALATLLGATAFGAGGGGLIGALIDLGVSESRAEVYATVVKEDGVLVTVSPQEDETEDAHNILQEAGADAVDIYEQTS